MEQLDAAERRAGLGSDYRTAPGRFASLLEGLHERTGQRAVVLVDEYDKPILDALEVPDVARANRDYLRGSVRGHQVERRPTSASPSSPG